MNSLTLDGIQDAFHAVMSVINEYDPTAQPIAEMPGAKAVSIDYGSFKVTSVRITTVSSDMRGGIVVISDLDSNSWENPLWMMQYGGMYPKSVLPFLTECLRIGYRLRHEFFGCRGPKNRQDGDLTYNNQWQGDFGGFNGHEYICGPDAKSRGYHWYRGYSLLDNIR